MIYLSPKALRFARLAVEAQTSAGEEVRLIDEIRHAEAGREREASISDNAARRCLSAIRALLRGPSADWDGNDIAYLETIEDHLTRGLAERPSLDHAS